MRSFGLRILVELNRSRGVRYSKDAIEEMQFLQIEAVKDRIAPQQRLYREALGNSLLPIARIKTDRCSVPRPRFPSLVVAVAFPKTEFFGFCKLQAVNPFSAFPSVQVGNYEPHWAAVVCRQRFAEEGVGEKVFFSEEVGDRNVSSVAAVAVFQDVQSFRIDFYVVHKICDFDSRPLHVEF